MEQSQFSANDDVQFNKDLQQATQNSLKAQEYKLPYEIEGKYVLNHDLASDGRCFSASIYYLFNNYTVYPSSDALNEWIQLNIINPILNKGSDNPDIMEWVYRFILYSDEIDLRKYDKKRERLQAITRNLFDNQAFHGNDENKYYELLGNISKNNLYLQELYPVYESYIGFLNVELEDGSYVYTDPQFGPGDVLASNMNYKSNIQIVISSKSVIRKRPYYYSSPGNKRTVYVYYDGVGHYMPLVPIEQPKPTSFQSLPKTFRSVEPNVSFANLPQNSSMSTPFVFGPYFSTQKIIPREVNMKVVCKRFKDMMEREGNCKYEGGRRQKKGLTRKSSPKRSKTKKNVSKKQKVRNAISKKRKRKTRRTFKNILHLI